MNTKFLLPLLLLICCTYTLKAQRIYTNSQSNNYTYLHSANTNNTPQINQNSQIFFDLFPNNDSICLGSDLSIVASLNDGISSYTYIWNSIPSAYTSTSDTLIINNLQQSTWFYCTISDGSTSITDSVEIYVYSLPNITFSPLSAVCNNALAVQLSASPSGGLFSGGGVIGSTFYPQISGAGTFNIKYEYTDMNGCSNIDSQNQIVHSAPIASIDAPVAGCEDEDFSIKYNGTAGTYTYNWLTDGGSINYGANSDSIVVEWATPGLKMIGLALNNGNCTSDTIYQYILIHQKEAMINSVGNTAFCTGDSVILYSNTGSGLSYQWYLNNIALTGEINSSFIAKDSGNYFVEVTNANLCSINSDTIEVAVFTPPTSDFTCDLQNCLSDTLIVSYSGSASALATYQWDFDSAIVISGSGQGPYQLVYQTSGTKNLSLLVIENSCSSSLTQRFVGVIEILSEITMIGDSNICEGTSSFLYANAAANLSHQWYKNGIAIQGATNPTLEVNQTGIYSLVNTHTIFGCAVESDMISISVHSTDFNLSFSATQTTMTATPFIVGFTNTTPNPNDYYFYWYFGDGQTSLFLNPWQTYLFNGVYSVVLIAENIQTGCRDTLIKPNYISCNGGNPNPCNIDPTITPSGSETHCYNDSILVSAIYNSNWSYQWMRNQIAISGADSSSILVFQEGSYSVAIYDTACQKVSSSYVLSFYPQVQPQIITQGSIIPCTNDSMKLGITSYFNSYLWSTGDTTQEIWIHSSGNYAVNVTDNYGCTYSSNTFSINTSLIQSPEICLVGVDTNNHNRIIWNKQNTGLIDSFYIYRETVFSDVYAKIGSIPTSSTALFVDTNSNPNIQSYRYRISALDSCGTETTLSPIHKTIHLTINKGIGSSWNLIWDNYEGFPYNSFAIYRGKDTANMNLLTQIQSSMNSYTDYTVNVDDTVFYQIEVVNQNGCYPDSSFSKAQQTNYNSSRSNPASNISFIDALDTYSTSNMDFSIYPNPNNGDFTLAIKQNQVTDFQVIITDIIGHQIYLENIDANNKQIQKTISLQDIERGIYFVKIKTKDAYKVKRIIIQ